MVKFNKFRLQTKSGRNNTGKITVRHRRVGNKKIYNIIDLRRNLTGISGVVLKVFYDSCRTGYIALVYYSCGIFSYILGAEGLKRGSIVRSYKKSDKVELVSIGDSLPLYKFPFGSLVYNVEIKQGFGGCLARSAGLYARLVGVKHSKYYKQGIAQLAVTSLLKAKKLKRIVYVNASCYASFGRVSNKLFYEQIIGKAGKNKWLGMRSRVRGVAMNPVDHPHGGRTAGGRPSVSPWGLLTKGVKTRSLVKKKKYKIFVKKINKLI